MKRIELGDFLLIAAAATGTEAHVLARQPRTLAQAQAALAAPFAAFGNVEIFPTFAAKAAVYCARIVA